MVTPGTRLGPYEIVALVGEGGMGQVYKARDTRLDRTVAIKILPPALAADPIRRERFEREARSISRLEHPNICALYDVGELPADAAGGALSLYLVMQFLDGETLAERLQRGPLSISQTLEYGIQIAEALATAHRAGIVHRDLKPGNVMITRSGAKLLDFGLARTVSLPGTAHTTTNVASSAPGLTTQGTILGTLSYMAPEQIDGREVDTRADVFAFGAVLFEMVTGLKAFDGESPARVISAILRDDPARVSTIVPVTPAALESLIHACMAKDPNDRWQNIADVARQLRHLRDLMSSGRSGSVVLPASAIVTAPARARWPSRLLWITGVVLAVGALGALAAALYSRRADDIPPLRLHALILPPDDMYLVDTMALSPDGRTLAFVAADATGRRRLWVRPLESPNARMLDNTEDAGDPFWSPDGKQIAFFGRGQLRRVAADGGAVATICETRNGAGGTWNRDDVIIFSPLDGPLMRVSAAGGRAEPLTALDRVREETHHLFPVFLPDGEHYIFYVASRERGLYVGSLASPARTRLFDPDPALPSGAAATPGVYATSGHILYVRDRVLTARRFDLGTLTASGEPTKVVETVDYDPPGQAAFTIANRVLVYRARQHRPLAELVWVDRTGAELSTIDSPPGTFRTISLSPDGRTVAVDRRDAQGLPSVWLVNTTSGASDRLPSAYWSGDPLWSADGRHLAYSIADDTPPNLVTRPDGGRGAERRITRDGIQQHYATSWTPDARQLVFEGLTTDTGWDLFVVDPVAERATPQRLLQTRANETDGRVSPDGRWLAYVSDESGQREVYLTRFPEVQGKWPISSGGGTQPFWRRDGAEVFYVSPDGGVHAVAIAAGAHPEISKPALLFRTTLYGNAYAPDPAGQRFLVARPARSADTVPLEIRTHPLQ